MKLHETKYYDDISNFISHQIHSDILSKYQKNVRVFVRVGEIKKELELLILQEPSFCGCLVNYANIISPLNVDLFVVVTDGEKYEIVIIEVKIGKNVGISEWSQLIGYCIVADAKFGILVNIDSGISDRMIRILRNDLHASNIYEIHEFDIHQHKLGMMFWNSVSKNFEYSGLGAITSLSNLSDEISQTFL